MRGINRVMVIGRLGSDPDTRFTAQGSPITNLSIATDESYKDKQTGQMVPKTEWHRVVLFNRLAEVAQEYLKKGAKVYIEGKLQTRKWTDKEGVERYSTEIIGHELQMLGSKGGSVPDYPEADNQAPADYPQQHVQRSPMADNPRGAVHPEYSAPAADDFDDIPF